MKHLARACAAVLFLATPAAAQHDHHTGHAAMNARGAQAMGFDQETTRHNFLLAPAGGAIRIVVKHPKDATGAAQIRAHLRHIRQAFASGDFSLPLFIHETVPPGADVLKARRETLTFKYEDVPDGGQLSIDTADAAALKALHEFLRFQIVEHRTGDPLSPLPARRP